MGAQIFTRDHRVKLKQIMSWKFDLCGSPENIHAPTQTLLNHTWIFPGDRKELKTDYVLRVRPKTAVPWEYPCPYSDLSVEA